MRGAGCANGKWRQRTYTLGFMTNVPDRMRAVRFHQWGPRSVLRVEHVPTPHLKPGRVLIRVYASAVNPGEALIRSGVFDRQDPAKLPSGQGTDLAGVVVAVAEGVSEFHVGQAVLGWSWERSSHAEFCSVPAAQLIAKPDGLSYEVAGALDVAGTTAYAAVRAVAPIPGETVVVSSAAGGVGRIAVQLLRARGIRVIGLASPRNHHWLRSVGAVPLDYRGDDIEERIGAVAMEGVDAFIDTFGDEYVWLAARLGVPANRVNTVIGFAAAAATGARTEASTDAADAAVLQELVDMISAGTLEVPVVATFPLDRVQDAVALQETRSVAGKIVLLP